jgi:hypothetical protein
MPSRTTFKKGYDPRRNVRGRPPRTHTISDILRAVGEETLPPDIRRKLSARFPDMQRDEKFINALARVVFAAAMRGEGWAVTTIFERCFGKVKDEIQVENVGPLVVFPAGTAPTPKKDGGGECPSP